MFKSFGTVQIFIDLGISLKPDILIWCLLRLCIMQVPVTFP